MSVRTTAADDSGSLFTVALGHPADGGRPSLIHTTVTASSADVAAWITNILSFHYRRLNSLLVGFDCEWRPSVSAGQQNPVAVLQLCVGRRCLVFQILRSDAIPAALVSFLSDPRFKFLGVGIGGDVERLVEDYEIGVRNAVDLRGLAAERFGNVEMRRMGLKKLAEEVMGVEVNKPRRVTMSRWDQADLMLDQIGYAAVDAFLSFEIGRMLLHP